MKLYTLLSTISLVICFPIIFGSCKSKGEQSSSTSSGDTTKRNHRNPSPPSRNETISDYQRKRIRNTIESTTKTKGEEKAALEFTQLLQDNPSDIKFLRELVLEINSAPDNNKRALAQALVRLYAAGELPKLQETLNALLMKGGDEGIMIREFAHSLCADHPELATSTYETLLHLPPFEKGISSDLSYLARVVGKQIGYREALEQVTDMKDNGFGKTAANAIIDMWTTRDPVTASTYLRDLPDSPKRNTLLKLMISTTAEARDFEMAHAWCDYLKGDSREDALKVVKIWENHARDEDEKAAKRKQSQ